MPSTQSISTVRRAYRSRRPTGRAPASEAGTRESNCRFESGREHPSPKASAMKLLHWPTLPVHTARAPRHEADRTAQAPPMVVDHLTALAPAPSAGQRQTDRAIVVEIIWGRDLTYPDRKRHRVLVHETPPRGGTRTHPDVAFFAAQALMAMHPVGIGETESSSLSGSSDVPVV